MAPPLPVTQRRVPDMLSEKRLVPRFAGALGAVVLACLGTLVLRPVLEPTPFILFLVAVMASAWFGGAGPGLTAFAAALVAVFLLWRDPSTVSLDLATFRRLVLFILIIILIGWLSSARRRAQEQLRFLADASQE